MRRTVLSTTDASGAATTSAVLPIDRNVNPTSIGLGLIVTGVVSCTVQHTFDDVFSPTFSPGAATWFSHATIAAAVANADGNYAYPVTGIRLRQASGNGSAQLVVLQSGIT